ncbi:MAG TPA: hypothetical protein V6C58_08665 [Allocoleopsis sp.]
MSQNTQSTIDTDVYALGVDSSYDEITTLAYNYRQTHVYPYLQEKGFLIARCQGKLARRPYVVLALKQHNNIKYITGNGHGSADAFTGEQFAPIFWLENYHPSEVTGKIIHLLSCKTAIELGADMVSNGCLAFFGYNEDFVIEPATSDVFFECDSEIDRAIADGLNMADVYQRVKTLYEKRIKEYKDKWSESLLGKDILQTKILKNTFSLLQINLNHLCCPFIDSRWGDTNISINSEYNQEI